MKLQASRRPAASIIVAVLFALWGVDELVEALLPFVTSADRVIAISAMQAVIGCLGVWAAIASWRRSRLAWIAGVLTGAMTSVLIVSLGPLLNLGAEQRSGLVTGAVATLVMGCVLAWFVRPRA